MTKPKWTPVKCGTVNLGEIMSHPLRRLDADYWLKNETPTNDAIAKAETDLELVKKRLRHLKRKLQGIRFRKVGTKVIK